MNIYLFPLEAAILSFLGLSTMVTIPYILFQYFKYGAVSKFRALILFSFFLYLLCAYYLVILPLPDPKTLAPIESIRQHVNFIPFKFAYDFSLQTTLKLTDIRTYFPALKQMVFFQPVFNIILTVPFGVYIGYYFKQNLKKTMLFTFCLSLFFEISQLSGLFGLYPRPYRLADVDDLMLNTFGGVIGYKIYQHFLVFLPPKAEIDEANYLKSEKVGYIRRFFAFLVDYHIVLFFSTILISLANVSPLIFNILLFGYFVVSHLLFKQTIGKALVHIKLQTENKEQNYMKSVVFRYMMLCLIITLINVLDFLVKNIYANGIYAILGLLALMLVLIDVIFGFKRGKILLYEKLSKTGNVSSFYRRVS
ncbi:MAG: VanZ family protein [Lachnospiraceae bacterium]|nr:VanZ family protein [Lachnospiraceae bacterium]